MAESEKGRGGRLKNGRKREGKRKKATEWQKERRAEEEGCRMAESAKGRGRGLKNGSK